MEYKICKRCIMDTTSDPNLVLDSNGICNYCHNYDNLVQKQQGERTYSSVEELFSEIKNKSRNKQYDCILGISGGVDSSFLAYLLHKHNMRVLAVHVDCGWNSELAVSNIEKICKKFNYDLHTVVVDWNTMKRLHRAFLYSGMANQDIPQDHAFIAATWKMATKYGIKYIVSGHNIATEGILSTAYQTYWADWINIKDVFNKSEEKGNLKKYPHLSLFDRFILYPKIIRLKTIKPLQLINYSQSYAIKTLEEECDWKYYGSKHYESRFTRFYQDSYLPERFGWDKRRDHLSSLVVSGEISRDAALKQISICPVSEEEKEKEKEYVLKKLDIPLDDWEKIINIPLEKAKKYKTTDTIKQHLGTLIEKLCKV